MEKLTQFIQADNAALKVLEKSTPLILEFLKTPAIPQTANSLYLLMGKIITIRQAIHSLRESENIYGINILLRSLIEHFLRLNYIMFKTMERGDDSIGHKYMNILYIKEQHELAKAGKRTFESIGKVVQPGMTWSLVNEMNEKSKQTTAKNVDDDVKEFAHYAIIKYILERIVKDKTGEDNLLSRLISGYSELSSFVHGGPLAEVILTQIEKEGKMEDRLQQITELVSTMFTSACLFLFMVFMQHDKRFQGSFNEIDLIIKKLDL